MIDDDLSPRTGSRRFTYETYRELIETGHEVKVYTTILDKEKCFKEYLSMEVEVVSGGDSVQNISSASSPGGLKKNRVAEVLNDFAYWSRHARLAMRISEKIASIDCDVALFHYHGEHWLLPYFYYLNKPNGAVYLNVVPPMPRPWALPFQELTLRKRLANALIDLPPVGNWENESFKNLSLFITPSRFQLEQARRQGLIGKTKAAVVPLGVNDSEFYPTGEDDSYALYLGRVHPHKSIELAIYSMRNSPRNCSLVIAGDVEEQNLWYKEKLIRLAKKCGIFDRFKFVEAPSQDQLVQLMQKCSVFLFPSTIDTFGLVVLEAMACGKPIVACNRGGVPEIVNDAGFLLEPDVSVWRETVSRLFKDNSLRKEMADKALLRSKDFSWKKTAESLLQSFEQLPTVHRKIRD